MALSETKQRQRTLVLGICEQLNITLTELARRAGVDPSTLTRFMNDDAYKHNLSATTLAKLESVAVTQLPLSAMVHRLAVRGVVAAGTWKDVSLMSDEPLGYIPAVNDERYPELKQYALLIEGTSINRRAKHGTYAICVEWIGNGRDVPAGKYVHVERHQGAKIETTIKLVRITKGILQLWPDSDDPLWTKPLDAIATEPDEEIRVRGLVIGWYAPA